MTESTKPAQCRDEDWPLARDCGLMTTTPGTNDFDAALASFAAGVLDGAAQMLAAFRQRVQPWMLECFGAEIAADGVERNHRFLEESLELVQACGCTRSEAHQLVDYVFSRPVGEKHQEVGGVMVTLAALCLAQSLDMHAAGETELARVWTKVEQIRAKQAAKPKHSPLPATPASEPAPIDMILNCPDCGMQHVDKAEGCPDSPGACECRRPHWHNPPHRSHLCHGCGHIWRPADVPTNGVAAINTKGAKDSVMAERDNVAAPTPNRLPSAVDERDIDAASREIARALLADERKVDCDIVASHIRALLQEAGIGAAAWQPISTAPNGVPMVVGWLDPNDPDASERHDFDCKDDGVWLQHADHYDHFCMVAPPGSRGPKEEAPYQVWMALPPIPTSAAGLAANKSVIAANSAVNSRRTQVIARAVAAHGREWPEQLTSGVMFYDGERITKAEFLAAKVGVQA